MSTFPSERGVPSFSLNYAQTEKQGLSDIRLVVPRGSFTLDTITGSVSIGNNPPIFLTSLEKPIITHLALNQGRIVPRRDIFEQMYPRAGRFVADNCVYDHIRRLRKKLGETSRDPDATLVTVQRRGYMLAPDPSALQEKGLIRLRVPRGDVLFNTDTGNIAIGDSPTVRLTPKETALVKKLAEHQGVIVNFRELATAFDPGNGAPVSRLTINVHINRIRKKIGENGNTESPTLETIVTSKRRSGGYRFVADPRIPPR